MARFCRGAHAAALALAVVVMTAGYSAPVRAACTDEATLDACAPGSGGTAVNCTAEWVLTPDPPPNSKGVPGTRIVCVEGAPGCDVDAEPGECTFQLSMCINNDDARLPWCLPDWLESFEVKSPRATSRDVVDAANRTAFEDLTLCREGSLCVPLLRDHTLVTGPERTSIRNETPNLCSDPTVIRVPLRQRPGRAPTKGKRSLTVVSTGKDGGDRDKFRLECLPGTCGNGVVEFAREECDDGNRLSGDGCDAWCHVEPTPTPTPMPTTTPTTTRSPSPTRTKTPTPTATTTATPTASLSPTPTPTPSPTRTPTATPTTTATATPSPTPTPSATSTPTPVATTTATRTATPLPTATATPSAPQPCNPDSETYSEPAFYRALAYRWAPIIIHDTASQWNADFIGRIDFDGDFRGNNNWNDLPAAGIAPYIYYNVFETSTHWFVFYNTFHPRDWDNVFFGNCAPFSDCHENDTENIFVMIQKDGSTYGRFRLMETEAHTSFYQYALANDGVSNGTGPDADDIDDDAERGFTLFTDTSVGVNDPRPAIYIESKGHGICDWWDNNGPYCTHPDDTVGSSNNDGVMYYPNASATPVVPPNPSGGQWYNFKYPYNLISTFDDVWVLRSCLGDGKTFDSPFTYPGVVGNGSASIGGALDGDDYSADAGTAWWAQNHGNLVPGDWGMDPARTVLRQLTFSEFVDTTYTYNPFFGID